MRVTPAQKEKACGSRESEPPFPFPLRGKPGRAGSPHAGFAVSPHKRGSAPPCASPLGTREQGDETRQPLGTFYFAEIRNFLLCVDIFAGPPVGAK